MTGQSSTHVDVQMQQTNVGVDPNLATLIGTVVNNGETTVKNPISVNVYCFTTSGALFDEDGSFTDGEADLTAGATASYTVDLDAKGA